MDKNIKYYREMKRLEKLNTNLLKFIISKKLSREWNKYIGGINSKKEPMKLKDDNEIVGDFVDLIIVLLMLALIVSMISWLPIVISGI